MCLSLDLPSNAYVTDTVLLPPLAHDAVSCAGSTHVYATLEDGRVAIYSSHQVLGANLIGFPTLPGHSPALVPCCATECIGPYGSVIVAPERFAPALEEEPPVYRSLGGDTAAFHCIAERVATMSVLVRKCEDGGASLVLSLSSLTSGGLSMEERAKLARPVAMRTLVAVEAADIDPARVFGDAFDRGDDSTWFPFVAVLLEALVPGMDVVLGIMPVGKKTGTFSFLSVFNDDGRALELPLLGVTHGETTHSGRLLVDEACFVLCNDPTVAFEVRGPPDGGDRDAHTLCVFEPKAFVDHAIASHAAPQQSERWRRNLDAVQKQAETAIVLAVDAALKSHGYPPMDRTHRLHARDLEGVFIPSVATSVQLTPVTATRDTVAYATWRKNLAAQRRSNASERAAKRARA